MKALAWLAWRCPQDKPRTLCCATVWACVCACVCTQLPLNNVLGTEGIEGLAAPPGYQEGLLRENAMQLLVCVCVCMHACLPGQHVHKALFLRLFVLRCLGPKPAMRPWGLLGPLSLSFSLSLSLSLPLSARWHSATLPYVRAGTVPPYLVCTLAQCHPTLFARCQTFGARHRSGLLSAGTGVTRVRCRTHVAVTQAVEMRMCCVLTRKGKSSCWEWPGTCPRAGCAWVQSEALGCVHALSTTAQPAQRAQACVGMRIRTGCAHARRSGPWTMCTARRCCCL